MKTILFALLWGAVIAAFFFQATVLGLFLLTAAGILTAPIGAKEDARQLKSDVQRVYAMVRR